jgi:3-isopropylmalate/(R)-2-methylmalate dehydratase small subunit
MENIICGQAFVLGDNIDTDQIIPAEFLTYNPADPAERKFFGKFALSGVPKAQSGLPKGNIPFVQEGRFSSRFAVIVAGRNFGCGSSREHAPLAIAEAGCKVVVAESYARIFYRNSINGGYVAPLATPQRLVERIATGDAVEVDLAAGELRHLAAGKAPQVYKLNALGEVAGIFAAGGIFAYAKQAGMLKSKS